MSGLDLPAIESAIRDVHRDRRWILAVDAAAAATALVAGLREDDAAGIMVVAAIEGVGDLPDADRFHYTRSHGDSIMDGIRAFLTSIEDPSADLLRAVDEFDPDGDAMVLGQGFSRRNHLAGRPVYGARQRRWRDLEDKTVVDELWDLAGVTRAPSRVVPVPEAASAVADLASTGGTVWVADNRTGWHGGGEYTRWVPPDADLATTAGWFSDRAERVRVMPFLEGIPCSIHGFVTADGVAVFLPVELFIMRRTDRPEFVYAQGATYWNPPAAITDEMRRAARSVGDHLRRQFGYRGGFGIDGVATVDGFRPTELNPRLTLGHWIQGRAAGVPLGPMERLMLEGDLDVGARAIEDRVLSVVREQRGGGMMFFASGRHERDEASIRVTDTGVTFTEDEETATGTMALGQAPSGSIVMVRFDPERIPVGPPLGPRTPHLMALADARWNLGLPPVEAPPDPFQ